MTKVQAFVLAAVSLLTTAFAGSVATPAPLKLASTAYTYTCKGGQSVGVQYVTTGVEKEKSPVFVVLTYKGQRYGLAEAVSASGTRYVGHAGLNTATGLEWWEHQNEGTLSTFTGDDAGETKVLVEGCKIKL